MKLKIVSRLRERISLKLSDMSIGTFRIDHPSLDNIDRSLYLLLFATILPLTILLSRVLYVDVLMPAVVFIITFRKGVRWGRE